MTMHGQNHIKDTLLNLYVPKQPDLASHQTYST